MRGHTHKHSCHLSSVQISRASSQPARGTSRTILSGGSGHQDFKPSKPYIAGGRLTEQDRCRIGRNETRPIDFLQHHPNLQPESSTSLRSGSFMTNRQWSLATSRKDGTFARRTSWKIRRISIDPGRPDSRARSLLKAMQIHNRCRLAPT